MDRPGSRQRTLGILLSYLHIAVQYGVFLLYMPFMLRRVGQLEYGIYMLSGSVAGYLSVFGLGLSQSYVRFHARLEAAGNAEAIPGLNALYLFVLLALGLLAGIAGWSLAEYAGVFFDESLSPYELAQCKMAVRVLSLGFAASLPTGLCTAYVLVKERFVFHRVLGILRTLGSPLVCMIMLWQYPRAITLVMVATAIGFFLDLCSIIYALARLGMRFYPGKMRQSGSAREIVTFSAWIAVHALVDQINWNVDKVLLGYFWGTAMTAVYGLAAQINQVFMQLSTAISNQSRRGSFLLGELAERRAGGRETQKEGRPRRSRIWPGCTRCLCVWAGCRPSFCCWFSWALPRMAERFCCGWAAPRIWMDMSSRFC